MKDSKELLYLAPKHMLEGLQAMHVSLNEYPHVTTDGEKEGNFVFDNFIRPVLGQILGSDVLEREPSGPLYMYLGLLIPRLRMAYAHTDGRAFPKHTELAAQLIGLGHYFLLNPNAFEREPGDLKQYKAQAGGRNEALQEVFKALNVIENQGWRTWQKDIKARS